MDNPRPLSSDRYLWVADGAYDSASHLVLMPEPFAQVVALCGASLVARDIALAVARARRCPACDAHYAEQLGLSRRGPGAV